MKEAQGFYDHKRQAHNGAYGNGCSACRELWAAYVAASKRKAAK